MKIYIPPPGPGRGSNGSPRVYYTITPVAGNATIDLANGLIQRIVLTGTPVTILAPVFGGGGSIVNGQSFTLLADQDATGGRAIPTFTGGTGGFCGGRRHVADRRDAVDAHHVFLFVYSRDRAGA